MGLGGTLVKRDSEQQAGGTSAGAWRTQHHDSNRHQEKSSKNAITIRDGKTQAFSKVRTQMGLEPDERRPVDLQPVWYSMGNCWELLKSEQ